MTVTEPDTVEARRRKLHMVAKEIGLSRDDRIELSQYILRRDITSWTELDEAQMTRMLDALEGYGLICHLKDQAP